jgi:hypothetical protein
MESNADVFLAPLQGKRVECSSIEDAVAVKTADALLRNGDACTTTELRRLSCILAKYNCHEAAERLSQMAARQRAAEYLTRTVGYERPC